MVFLLWWNFSYGGIFYKVVRWHVTTVEIVAVVMLLVFSFVRCAEKTVNHIFTCAISLVLVF